ncbi:hypothetical protein Tco_0718723 [Tanacetum coccineum]
MSVPNVQLLRLMLMLCPFSIEGKQPDLWLEYEPLRSIQTWEFLYQIHQPVLPPSKRENLRMRSQISAENCIKLDYISIMLLEHYLDQDSLNSAAGRTSFCSAPAPAPVKAVELSCVTCGGAHYSPKLSSHTWQLLADKFLVLCHKPPQLIIPMNHHFPPVKDYLPEVPTELKVVKANTTTSSIDELLRMHGEDCSVGSPPEFELPQVIDTKGAENLAAISVQIGLPYEKSLDLKEIT